MRSKEPTCAASALGRAQLSVPRWLLEEFRPPLVRRAPLRGFDLDPTRARTRLVRRILALAHDALEAEARTFSQQGVGVREALAEAQQVALATG